MSDFMDGYHMAFEDMAQALDEVPCRCGDKHTLDRCMIYRADLNAIIMGALRGCNCEPP